MFEKEAKERAEEIEAKQTLGVYDNDEDLARDEGWNDGYVSGYEEGFQDGAEFGYNKANEWHYVKGGDLPKEFDKPYLCRVFSHFEVGYFTAYKEQPWHFDEYYLDNEDVIAWKEIVLPEEIKENDIDSQK